MFFLLSPRYQFLLVTVLLSLITLLTLPRAALAGTVIGDGTPESCTPEAFTAAMAGDGLINFNCGTNPVTITFDGGYITNPGTTVDGGNLIILSKGAAGDHFQVNAGGNFTVTNITLRGNLDLHAGGVGVASGGIFASDNVTFTQNGAEVGGSGGGLYTDGTATLTATTFSENEARVGGGMYNGTNASAILTNVDFSDNVATYPTNAATAFGGGLANAGILSYRGGVLIDNRVELITGTTKGGGIFNGGVLNNNILTIEDVLIASNDAFAGSAIYASGGQTLARNLDVLFNGRSGDTSSAIEVHPDPGLNGVLRLRQSNLLSNIGIGVWIAPNTAAYIEDSTLAGNTLRGLFLQEVANVGISNSTITSNTNSILLFGSTLYMQDSTVTNNGESNIELVASSALTLTNSIASGGTVGNCAVETGSAIHSGGFNLSDDSTCSLSQTTDITDTNPLLLRVSDYGGSTFTQLPDVNSPVIDHGRCDPSTPTDQRGIPRPQGVTCDIGAVERAPSDDATPTPPPTETPTATTTPSVTPTGTLTATPTGTPPTFDAHLFLPLVQR